jgi:hypothetical protein
MGRQNFTRNQSHTAVDLTITSDIHPRSNPAARPAVEFDASPWKRQSAMNMCMCGPSHPDVNVCAETHSSDHLLSFLSVR